MAITDLQISEELMTDAPSIKYRGDEGPKSPQEEQQMMVDALLKEEYNNYVYDLLEQRPDATPMSFEEFRRMVISEGQMSGGQPLPEDPTKPINPFAPKPTGPVLPDKREMAAYGGIMGLDGRRQYGIGSYFQKLKDKFVDDIIPNEIKENPLLTAAAVAGGDYILNDRSYLDPLKDLIMGKEIERIVGADRDVIKERQGGLLDKGRDLLNIKTGKDRTLGEDIKGSIAKNILPLVGGLTAGIFTKNQPKDQTGMPSDNTALQIADLKKSANLLTQPQGLAAGLNFLPDVAARKFTPEEMAITYAQAANGGRIGFDNGGSASERYEEKIKELMDKGLGRELAEAIVLSDLSSEAFTIPVKKAEGGLMDLGGMEKDYRAEGGFVPIGKEEKADDVPARLSVNEFVFTADAVRNAGGGDIDQGAKVMENMMKHLEAGGQVSEESQGMAGARDMFATSQRLGDVV